MPVIAFDAPTLDEALRGVTPEPDLSSHELDVARLLAAGANMAEIAAITGKSDRSVPYTITRLLEKTHTRSEAHLVTKLHRRGKIA